MYILPASEIICSPAVIAEHKACSVIDARSTGSHE